MDEQNLHQLILDTLAQVAPEVDPNTLNPASNFRDQFEMDSMDFLGFVLKLEKRLGCKIPELDYPKLSSLQGCLAYLQGMSTLAK